MDSRRLVLETLEPRVLLSVSSELAPADALLLDASLEGPSTEVPGDLDVTTRLTLVGGETLTLGIAPSDLVEGVDLAGVSFQFEAEVEGVVLTMSGSATTGHYSGGLVYVEGPAVLESSLEYSRDPATSRVSAGSTVVVTIDKSEFLYAAFTDAEVEADVNVGSSVLRIGGTATSGRINEEYKIDLGRDVTVREDFSYTTGPATTRLAAGASVRLDTNAGAFVEVVLDGAEMEMDLVIDGGTARLMGTVGTGVINSRMLDYDASTFLVEDFVYAEGPLTATLKMGGGFQTKVEASVFQYAELALTIEADITIEGSVLKLQGGVDGKIHEDSKLDLDGSIQIAEDFVYERGAMTATLKSGGDVGVAVQQSAFQYATLDGVALVADVSIAESVLKLEGSVDGKVDESYEVDFDGSLRIVEDFVYVRGPMTATLKSGGDVGLSVMESAFQYATLEGVAIAADITIEGSVLKLEGAVDGKIDESYEVDLDGSLRIVEDFVYVRGPMTATLKSGGDVGVTVTQSQFVTATLDVEADVDVAIADDGGSSNLKLGGTVKGTYENDEMDLGGTLAIREDFEYVRGPMTAVLKSGGDVGVTVTQSQFVTATLDVEADVDVAIADDGGSSNLKLGGTVQGTYENDEMDFDGSMRIKEDFVYERGKITATLKSGGDVGVKVKESKFKYSEFDVAGGIAITVDVGSKELRLEGGIKGKYENDEMALDGSMRIVEDFEYVRGPMTATLKSGGDVGVTVAQSQFVTATLDVEADVDVAIPDDGGSSNLKLGGTVQGTYENDEMDFDGSMRIVEDFDYVRGPMTAVLKSGGDVGVTVTQSQFMTATFDVDADVDVVIADDGGSSNLKLGGTVKGTYENDEMDFDGSMRIVEDFEYTADPILVKLGTGGDVELKVEQSKFKMVEFEVGGEADVKTGQGDLKLGGTLKGKYENDKIDIDATLDLIEPWTYTTGPVTATLKSGGEVGVKVEESQFRHAALNDIGVDVQVDVDQGPLKLRGTIDGKYENGEVDFDGSLRIAEDFEYAQGVMTATLKSGGEVGVKVEASQFKHAALNDISVDADVLVQGVSTLKLGGSVSGKYENGKMDFGGALSLREDFAYSRGIVAMGIAAGQEVTLDTNAGTSVAVGLDGVEMEADVTLAFWTLELEGTIGEGSVVDGLLGFDADLDLQSPLILWSGWFFEIAIVSADVDLSMWEGQLSGLGISDVEIVVQRPSG